MNNILYEKKKRTQNMQNHTVCALHMQQIENTLTEIVQRIAIIDEHFQQRFLSKKGLLVRFEVMVHPPLSWMMVNLLEIPQFHSYHQKKVI